MCERLRTFFHSRTKRLHFAFQFFNILKGIPCQVYVDGFRALLQLLYLASDSQKLLLKDLAGERLPWLAAHVRTRLGFPNLRSYRFAIAVMARPFVMFLASMSVCSTSP
jgi:hypothetical protein